MEGQVGTVWGHEREGIFWICKCACQQRIITVVRAVFCARMGPNAHGRCCVSNIKGEIPMKLKKTALVGTLQKTGLQLRRAIIKEVRGHF